MKLDKLTQLNLLAPSLISTCSARESQCLRATIHFREIFLLDVNYTWTRRRRRRRCLLVSSMRPNQCSLLNRNYNDTRYDESARFRGCIRAKQPSKQKQWHVPFDDSYNAGSGLQNVTTLPSPMFIRAVLLSTRITYHCLSRMESSVRVNSKFVLVLLNWSIRLDLASYLLLIIKPTMRTSTGMYWEKSEDFDRSHVWAYLVVEPSMLV